MLTAQHYLQPFAAVLSSVCVYRISHIVYSGIFGFWRYVYSLNYKGHLKQNWASWCYDENFVCELHYFYHVAFKFHNFNYLRIREVSNGLVSQRLKVVILR